MILCDRFNYKLQYLYTFGEVLDVLVSNTGGGIRTPLDATAINEILGGMDMLPIGYVSNPYSLSFVLAIEDDQFSVSDLAVVIINKLDLRYKDHYCFASEVEYTQTSDVNWQKLCQKFMQKVFNVLDYTFDKYNTLIGLYTEQKSHLLDKLSRSRSGSREISSEGEHSDTTDNISLFNDTPQTTDVVATIEGNQYVSELNKGQVSNEGSNSSSGSDEFEENELFDTKTIMAKLDEVEKQYSNVIKKWLNEFDELFIEEVNY